MNEISSSSASVLDPSFFTQSGPIGLSVLGVLIIFSVITWSIIVERWRLMKRQYQGSQQFMKHFAEAKSMMEVYAQSRHFKHSPACNIFVLGHGEIVKTLQAMGYAQDKAPLKFTPKDVIPTHPLPLDFLKRTLTKAQMQEYSNLTKNINILALAASVCPFIGLLGTVLGIIRAFQDVGTSGSTSLAAVAPGISEALVATALGLLVAIPALIFYNLLLVSSKKHKQLLEGFCYDFLNAVDRRFNINAGG